MVYHTIIDAKLVQNLVIQNYLFEMTSNLSSNKKNFLIYLAIGESNK